MTKKCQITITKKTKTTERKKWFS